MKRRRQAVVMLTAVLALSLSSLSLGAISVGAAASVVRVNAGAGAISGTPTWEADSKGSPSPYVNASETGNRTSSTSAPIVVDASVPAGTPAALFASERWDPAGGAEMAWKFPVTAGQYDVRLYFADTYSGTQAVGARMFDVVIEGALVLDNYDIFADVGGFVGVMKSFRVSSDSTLNVDFGHVKENPTIRGVEIVPVASSPGQLSASPTSVDFGSVAVGSSGSASVTLTNSGGAGDPSIVVSGVSVSGTDAAQFAGSLMDGTAVTLAPGQSTSVAVTFAPVSEGAKSASLEVAHDGTNTPLSVALSGTGSSVSSAQLSASPTSVDFGSVAVGSSGSASVTLTNTASSGGPSISVTGTTVSGTDAAQFADSFVDGTAVTLAPGQSTSVTVTFAPVSEGAKSASLEVAHDGTNTPLSIALAGSGAVASTAPSFGKSALANEVSNNPTTLHFGPDGRLYVAQFNGMIYAYSISRNAANDYVVTGTEAIDLVNKMPNHNDDGVLNTTVKTRIVTGLIATGTATHPRLYVTSSDPRIGGGSSGEDKNLDTNSSVLSRLDWDGGKWVKTDVVRGLPRSEENHSANGLQLDTATNTLYIAQGGNTNAGAPSNNFALLPEVALSAAVLSVDLDLIGDTPYDLPTLDDETRSGTTDANDPLGGSDGRNQAKLVPGGPVQVHASGFRNPYDLLLHSNGGMFTIDNGGNAGWGDIPIGEGPAGTCTNQVSEPGVSDPDTLHLVSGAGYYGGHPNPTRGNSANTFNADKQSPVEIANPIECDYLKPGSPEHPGLTSWKASTNGLDEYTATNFSRAMEGDILTAGYSSNTVSRVELDTSGTTVLSNTALFSTVGKNPLDLVAQGDSDVFPGTVWVADMSGPIYAFEPADYGAGGGGTTCSGQYSATLDEDGDGFTNADEIDNGTSPCSSADVPPDADSDAVSDLNDPDDDNDGIGDTSDEFAVDALNGTATTVPVTYTWDNGAPPADGLLGLGFTGLMTNGTSDYLTLFDPTKMTAGGAAGATTVDEVPPGTATGASNSQAYAFQFGVAPPGELFTAHTRLLAPFSGILPEGDQSMGLYVGTGGQDDFVEITATAGNGTPGLRVRTEVGGVTTTRPVAPLSLPGPDAIDLYLTIDPAASTVRAGYVITTGGAVGSFTALGTGEAVPSSWFTTQGRGLAVGIISTSAGGSPFPATWDLIEVLAGAPAPDTDDLGHWETLAPTGLKRQEVSYVKAGSKFYLAGGGTAHQAYDPATNTWSNVASLPNNLDHIQGAEVNGLVYYIGGLEAWPSPEVTTVYIYNPTTNSFTTGAPMPRGRGAGGVAVHDGKIYYAGGLHEGAAVAWFDVYDPMTDSWSALPDMPRVRDHFQAAVLNGKFYAIGGRDTAINATTTANDVFDFTTEGWTSGLAPLPTARGGFAAAVLGDEILVIGGEGGGKTWGEVEAYKPATDSWRPLAPMPVPRHGIQGIVCQGSVYIAAGSTKQGSGPTDVHERFSIGSVRACF